MHLFSLRALSLSLLATGCGSVILDDPPADNGTSSTGGLSTGTVNSTSATSGTASVGASSTSSGTGGAESIPPLACASGETVIVAAAAQGSAQAAFIVGDSWFSFWSGPPLSALFAYLDPFRRFGVLATNTEGAMQMWREEEPGLLVEYATSFTALPTFLAPVGDVSSGPILTPGPDGWRIAWYHADLQDWFAGQSLGPQDDWTPTAITTDRQTGRITVVGRTFAGDVCTRDSDADGFLAPLTCVPGIVSPTSEIPNTGPRIVSLDDGTQVLLFMPQAGDALAAVTRNGGAWSAPVTIESTAIGLTFAATPSASGDVVVGAVSTSGDLSLLRFSGATGWRGPTTIGGGYDYAAIAAGPGACGADAFIGATRGGLSVDVARVYGMQAAVGFALPFGDDFAYDIRFVVRPPVP